MVNQQDPDRDLVRRCQDVNSEEFEAAFAALFARYRDRVYSIAYRIVGSATDAMDVVQESFSLLFRKLASFRHDALFSTWLFRLVVNCAIDHRRSQASGAWRRTGSFDPQDGGSEFEDGEAPAPLETAAQHELGDHVQRALMRLNPKLNAILVLRYLQGMSYEELRDVLGISMGTVKSRLARAHIAIEKVLEGSLEKFGYHADPSEVRSQRSEGLA